MGDCKLAGAASKLDELRQSLCNCMRLLSDCPLPPRAVQFVTMHQLIDWIRNPIPKDQMKEKFNVRPAGWECGCVARPVHSCCPQRRCTEQPHVLHACLLLSLTLLALLLP